MKKISLLLIMLAPLSLVNAQQRTTNYIPRFSIALPELENSVIYQSSSNYNIGINTTAPFFKFDVAGEIRIQGANKLYFGGTGHMRQLKGNNVFISCSKLILFLLS